jgi:lipopolysaccharide biosynthesis glycosyltransferase
MRHTVTILDREQLATQGLLRRPTDARGANLYDIHSNAPASTEFAITRFLVPFLAQQGCALFVDSDVVFLSNPEELLALHDERYAVRVVKHHHDGAEGTKMAGRTQLAYPRKNWSSVVLWNCDHPANRRLSLIDVQERRGFDLHQFYWLHDSEIGDLPAEWNWLVGVQPKPEHPKIAHFTLGGPFIEGWRGSEHDDLWHKAAQGHSAHTDFEQQADGR